MASAPGNPTTLHNGRTWRRIMRIDRAARLTAEGIYSNADIARHIGINVQTLVYIKQTPEFQARMVQIKSGVMAQEDIDILESLEFQKEQIKAMVPTALSRLQTLLLSKNEQIAYKALQEVLDRDGNHSKVSRTSVSFEDKTDYTRTNALGLDILAVVKGTPVTEQQDTANIMEAFTKGAVDADTQINFMADAINEDTLDQIDASKLKVQ